MSDRSRELTDVEKTAVQVCLVRSQVSQLLENYHWDPSCDAALAAMLPEELQKTVREKFDCWGPAAKENPTDGSEHLTSFSAWWRPLMAIRTAEIDQQALAAGLLQVVILGAGLDPRAWRLPWAKGTSVYEVDSGSVEELKLKVLEDNKFHMAAACRFFVRADLGAARETLPAGLLASGFQPELKTLWIMEGLIGYLSRDQGNELFSTIFSACAPGSRVVMTGAPTLNTREAAEARGQKLHHVTFEAAEETLARLQEPGWKGCILTADFLAEKYHVENDHFELIVAEKLDATA